MVLHSCDQGVNYFLLPLLLSAIPNKVWIGLHSPVKLRLTTRTLVSVTSFTIGTSLKTELKRILCQTHTLKVKINGSIGHASYKSLLVAVSDLPPTSQSVNEGLGDSSISIAVSQRTHAGISGNTSQPSIKALRKLW